LLALAACGPDPVLPPDTTLPDLPRLGGAEAVLLRLPVDGGTARAYRWPQLDSAVWRAADPLPVLGSVLAFDPQGGLVALTDSGGRPGRLDLRTGRVFVTDTRVTAAASADGWTTYGLVDGRVLRVTPNGVWRGPERRADDLLPLASGDVVLVAHSDIDTRFVRLRPPATAPIDSVTLPRVLRSLRTANGDRWYLETAEGLRAVETRSFAEGAAPDEDAPRALAVSPSGDRVVTLDADGERVRIWERYSGRTAATITLAAPGAALRMDPLGRFVLVRDAEGDSVRVLSLPLAAMAGVVASAWRDDLPLVTPEGAVLGVSGDDVVLREARTGTEQARLAGGAQDRWLLVPWDGFRPRDRSLDAPVVFEPASPADSAAEAEAIDSLLAVSTREALSDTASLAALGRAGDGPPPDSAEVASSYTLAFAALLSESRARALADRIRVDGRAPRVVAGTRDGVAVYRVVAGPFPTREAAEAAGRRTGVSFWVFAGLP
jgi:cell division septation protein DedD